MKKTNLKFIATILAFSMIVILLTGCGNISDSKTVETTEENITTKEVVKEVEVIKEIPVVSTETVVINKEDIVIDTASEVSGSFKETIENPLMYKEVYFSQPRIFNGMEDGVKWTSDNTEIAIVDQNGIVTAVDEGTTVIRCYDESGEETVKYNIYCTTANDGTDPVCYTTELGEYELLDMYDSRDAEYIQKRLCSIRDVMQFLEFAGYDYDMSAPILVHEKFTWAMTGEQFLTSSGVCCDVANFGAFALQNDYEELGFIFHCGYRVGHVYNYVYEDGFYYIFDLTDVIGCESDYRDFGIYKVEKLEDFTDEILEWKADPNNLAGVVAVSSFNHPYQPALYLSYIADDSALLSGEYCCAGFENGLPFEVLYTNPDMNFEFVNKPLVFDDHNESGFYDTVPSYFRSNVDVLNGYNLYQN